MSEPPSIEQVKEMLAHDYERIVLERYVPKTEGGKRYVVSADLDITDTVVWLVGEVERLRADVEVYESMSEQFRASWEESQAKLTAAENRTLSLSEAHEECYRQLTIAQVALVEASTACEWYYEKAGEALRRMEEVE